MSVRSIKELHLRVVGTPAPKGSFQAMKARARPGEHPGSGRAVLVPGGSKQNRKQLSEWRTDVIAECMKHPRWPDHPRPVFDPDYPLAIAIIYRQTIPSSMCGKYGPGEKAFAIAPTGRDVDKLDRSTFDAITQSKRVWIDDARAAAPMAVRRYVQIGEWVGAEIMISTNVLGVIKWYYDQVKRAEAEMAAAKAAARAGAVAARARRGISPAQGSLLR